MSSKNERVYKEILDQGTHRHACVLPKGGRYLLWVQSPNERWMLLSGAWNTERGAAAYARHAGYELGLDQHVVLDQIERQMELRATPRPERISH